MTNIASAKSLKEGNRIYVGLIIAVNSLLLYAVAQESTISVAGLKALLTESTNLLPVGFAYNCRERTSERRNEGAPCFLENEARSPWAQGLSKYAASDPRVDISNLKKICGNKFPDDPVEQNRTWYRLYKTVEGNPSVLQVQRDFLLMRDYVGLAALFVVVFGSVALNRSLFLARVPNLLSVPGGTIGARAPSGNLWHSVRDNRVGRNPDEPGMHCRVMPLEQASFDRVVVEASFSGVRTMHTYEKAPAQGRRRSNYTGLLVVICLFASMFAAWALMGGVLR